MLNEQQIKVKGKQSRMALPYAGKNASFFQRILVPDLPTKNSHKSEIRHFNRREWPHISCFRLINIDFIVWKYIHVLFAQIRQNAVSSLQWSYIHVLSKYYVLSLDLFYHLS